MTRPLRVLHLEDHAGDAAVIRDRLEFEGVRCEIRLTDDQAGFESALAEATFDLIIADYHLPGYDGMAALSHALTTQPNVPVILVSGTVSEEEAVKCLQFGATDYLLKGRLDRLAPAVRRAIEEAETRVTRKRAEVALAQSEKRKAAILDSVLDCIITMDADGVVTEFNNAAERTFGYTKAQAIGRPLAELIIPPAVRQAHRGGLARYLATGIAPLLGKVVEMTAMRADGSELQIELAITTIHTEQSPIFTGVMRDVTERNRAVTAQRTADERMRFALESANVGIWDWDFATGVVRWSEILEAQYGLTPGSFGGTLEALTERIHPDDRPTVLDTIGKATQLGTDFSILHRTLWPDGTVHWLSGAGRIVLGEDGQPSRGIGISQDVTKRHQLEQLSQQTQKMEAIGQLAGGVAHDFNNLLTVILGYCEMLLEDLDAKDRCALGLIQIQKAGVSAAGLTRQLLAFSRKEIISPTLLDLNVVLAGMRVMLRRLIREDVKIELTVRPELALVMADRGQIEQIVLNLSVNARDAMPKGGTLKIEIANVDLDSHYASTHVEVQPGPYVALTVSDTGEGIPPEVQARLFEPFFTTKEPGRGTGLGLATVHGIVTQNGGSIDVQSTVGAGASFRLYFPRAQAAAAVVEAPVTVGEARSGGETVVVVEDEEGLRLLITSLLERLGYTVLVASNAAHAIELFGTHPAIDLLLTDVVMPGGSGPDLSSWLVEGHPQLKVLYMSGYTDEAIVHHGVLDPGIAFLHKPFTSEALGQKIRQVLDQELAAGPRTSARPVVGNVSPI